MGNVSILSGPVPGLFQGAPNGADAFFAYQNSLGGVNGRKIVLKSSDDAFSCDQNTNETQSLSGRPSPSWARSRCSTTAGPRFSKLSPTFPTSPTRSTPWRRLCPTTSAPSPSRTGGASARSSTTSSGIPKAMTNVGAIVANIPSALASWNNEKAAMQSLGYHISYERDVNPLDTDFTSDVLRMRNAGVQMVVMNTDMKRPPSSSTTPSSRDTSPSWSSRPDSL